MKHGVDYKRHWYRLGDTAAVYPFTHRGKPFIGTVKKIKINRYKRVSYVICSQEWQAEELFPDRGQSKLRIRCTT